MDEKYISNIPLSSFVQFIALLFVQIVRQKYRIVCVFVHACVSVFRCAYIRVYLHGFEAVSLCTLCVSRHKHIYTVSMTQRGSSDRRASAIFILTASRMCVCACVHVFFIQVCI